MRIILENDMNIDLQQMLSLSGSQVSSFQKEDLNELREDLLMMRDETQKDLQKNKKTYDDFENLKKSWLKLDMIKDSLGVAQDEQEQEKRLHIATQMEGVLSNIKVQEQNLQDVVSMLHEIDIMLLHASFQ